MTESATTYTNEGVTITIGSDGAVTGGDGAPFATPSGHSTGGDNNGNGGAPAAPAASAPVGDRHDAQGNISASHAGALSALRAAAASAPAGPEREKADAAYRAAVRHVHMGEALPAGHAWKAAIVDPRLSDNRPVPENGIMPDGPVEAQSDASLDFQQQRAEHLGMTPDDAATAIALAEELEFSDAETRVWVDRIHHHGEAAPELMDACANLCAQQLGDKFAETWGLARAYVLHRGLDKLVDNLGKAGRTVVHDPYVLLALAAKGRALKLAPVVVK